MIFYESSPSTITPVTSISSIVFSLLQNTYANDKKYPAPLYTKCNVNDQFYMFFNKILLPQKVNLP